MRKFGVHYLSLPGSETIKVIDFMRTDVLNRIKETLRKVIPAGGHAFLYGSQARNEARPDSDWGILILFSPFVHSVKDKGIQFLSAEDITADSRCKPIMG